VRTTAIRGTAAAVLLSATVLGLAGCVNAEKAAPAGAGDNVSYGAAPTTTTPPAPSSGANSIPASADHNQADVTFAKQGALLRQQAVTMANLAANSTNAQVRTLGAKIAQDNVSVTTMTGWLSKWGQPAPSSSDTGTGVLSAGQLQQLSTAKGTSFDMQWLQFMGANLTAARQAATSDQSGGKDAQAKQLATTWAATLQSELTTINGIR
jgi:uncharacterized protein (DUF305 family)